MAIEHTNRRRQAYYLHAATTRTGKPKYYFSTSAEGELVEAIPEGYEVHENVDGQVFLRKIQPVVITDQEVAVVESQLRHFARLKDCLVERKGKTLTVYAPDFDTTQFDVLQMLAPGRTRADIEEMMEPFRNYSPEMKFVLLDKAKRTFQAMRFCYLGAIDDWMDIGSPGPIGELSKLFFKYIGTEEYFDLG